MGLRLHRRLKNNLCSHQFDLTFVWDFLSRFANQNLELVPFDLFVTEDYRNWNLEKGVGVGVD